MTSIQNRLRGVMCALLRTGFFSIVTSTLLNKVLVFMSGMVLVRVLSKNAYGAYSYAINIINYFILLNGLGTSSCVVQYCVEQNEAEKSEKVYRLLCSMGCLWDFLLTAAIVLTALFVKLPIEGSAQLLLILAPYPLLSLVVDYQQQRLRSQFRNSEYSWSTNINTVLVVASSIVGAILASSSGLVVGRSIAMLASGIAVLLLFRVSVHLEWIHTEKTLLFDILKMSLTVCLTNAVSQLLILLGTTLVGSILGEGEAVATYSTATSIPFALSFIPSMLVTYSAPYFVKNAHDRHWVLRSWSIGTIGLAAICLTIAIVSIAASGWLIPLLFGAQYGDAVPVFNLMMIAFALGAPLRTFSGNILATHRKYGFNLLSGLISLAVCYIGTMFLVPSLGIEGAAIGYLAAMVVGAVINVGGVLVFSGRPTAHEVL